MKKIISLAIRFIPRHILQLFSHIVLRMLVPFYRGNKVECPVCNSTFSSFLPYGRIVSRPNALCPRCLSLERHRLMWLYLKEKTAFFQDKHKVLHIAPEACFINRFKKLSNLDYTTADLISPLADVKMDVHDIPFDEETFDVVFCNHVMEHVDDDIKSMSEIYRVLRPGGWAIIQSPVYYHLDATFEDPSITDPFEREKAYGQSDHVRIYGADYGKRLQQAGFHVTENNYVKEMPTERSKRFALPMEEIIYFCKKK